MVTATYIHAAVSQLETPMKSCGKVLWVVRDMKYLSYVTATRGDVLQMLASLKHLELVNRLSIAREQAVGMEGNKHASVFG